MEGGTPEIIERHRRLLDASKLRLKLLGLSQKQIKELEERLQADITLISQSDKKAWIQADIYEQDLSVIKAGQKATVRPKGYNTEFKGRIYAIEELINPRSRSAKARIEIDTHGELLRFEVFAEVEIEVDLGNRLSIPRTALIDTGLRRIVYLDMGEGRYVMGQVAAGVETRDFVEILEGLREGDLVVTEGNFLLDSQSTLTGGQSLLYGAGEEVKTETPKAEHRH